MLPSSTSSSSSYQQPSSSFHTNSNSLLYYLSLLKEKFHQLECEVSLLISPTNSSQPQTASTATAIANMGDLVEDITVTSSSILLTCQQMTRSTAKSSRNLHDMGHVQDQERGHHGFWASENFKWFNHNNHFTNPSENINGAQELTGKVKANQVMVSIDDNCDIVELDAADLLAKYTHYCQICGKGFKRDANLRMHMRAHGDEYKSRAALINPMKRNTSNQNSNVNGAYFDIGVVAEPILPRKYSCPQEGCRWNKKHDKFQPLKSMICVKNHYKRSHCPKMYICKRCNNKEFSVLSDLKTHEKHCGDVKWRCSCGTTFSRKDKLVGHVALFVGHVPVTNIAATTTTNKMRKLERTGPRG